MVGGALIVLTLLIVLFFGNKKAPTGAANSGLSSSSGSPISGIVQTGPSVTSAEAAKINQEFINQLLNLQAIKLDDSIFSSLAFQSLEDFTIVLIQPGNEGRPNPFAPFGIDAATGAPLPGIQEGGLNVIPVDSLPNSGS